MAQPSGRANARFFLCVAGVLSLIATGCGSKSSVDDRARLDACALTGATTNDGCDTGPSIRLGDLTMGAWKSRDLALYNGGAGQVAAVVSSVALDGAALGNYAIVKTYRLDASLAEVPVTLPFDLAVNHGTELRVRVAFTANAPIGAVSGVAVRVVTSHPAGALLVPITGQITGCPVGLGNCDADASNGCEVDLQASLTHCGACDTGCGDANATAACSAGTCEIGCAAGFGNCDGNAANGCEADLLVDAVHCASCDVACDSTNGTASCAAGACAVACDAGFADCDADASNGCEVDLGTSSAHCGACGTVCASTNGTGACSAGLCVTSCDAGFANCDGSAATGCEVALASDLAHCGACGAACSSTNGTPACTAGACRITCAAGFADCDGNVANGCEVDLGADAAHCGACGAACSSNNGTPACAAGACQISCATGFANCDGSLANGCEVDLSTTVASCGACGAACSATNGTPSCSAGACAVACTSGFGNCDGSAANGCEVNLQGDVLHCGGCALACGTAHATPACTAGTCGLGCDAGYADCNAANADGCEVGVLFDTANCGACGAFCSAPNGTPSCAAGTCAVAACSAGFADCNGLVLDGCETNLASDVASCGGCGNLCSVANGSAACVAGGCALAACNAGWSNCDGNAVNGCEVNVAADPANCSACGTVCSVANGTSSCSAGACGVAACNAGWGDCDGSALDGCETDLLVDPVHCSACGAACDTTNGTATCSAGACAIACDAGFGDCDGDAANGCEVDLGTSSADCGVCGTVCASVNGSSACTAGLCLTSCDAGFANCDGSAANGCEVVLASDLTHCGACGATCSSANGTPACAGGACQISCAAGFADCDGSAGTGCEVELGTDAAHCGACGAACSANNGTPACAAGACQISCSAGFANCDGSVANGCEVDLGTTVTSCGACGAACSANNGTPACASGACQISCSAGFANCDGSAVNGCEVSLQGDVLHCGGCGLACGTANAAPACNAGTCGLGCSAGYADCNGLNADGCEVGVLFDAANCGACGAFCSAPNGSPACAAGSCVVAACVAGFADCNGLVPDGCETNLATDVASCGGCGNVCTIANGSAACVAGGCAVAACDAGWSDCDGNPANGCELNTSADPSNCGACGVACFAPNGIPSCSAGACGVAACNAGFADCNGFVGDGCEVDTTADVANCGACGNACNLPNAAGTACFGSTCAVTACAANFYDQDGVAADGCECAGDGNASLCAAPGGGNALSPGQSVGFTGNLAPLGKSEYFQVTFSGNTSTAYHPVISLSSAGNFAKFDVLAPGCASPAAGCGSEGGASIYLTAWEAFNGGVTPSCYTNGSCIFPPLPGAGGTVVIRVFAAASTTTCGGFSLVVGN